MIILAICSLLLGTIFGRFYKVMVLIPASALLFAVVCANFTILEFAVLSTCLLVGYASGLLFFIPEIWRRHKHPSAPSHPGRAKRQRGTRILFKRAAPLTGFASVTSNPAFSFDRKASGAAVQSNGVRPSLFFGAASL